MQWSNGLDLTYRTQHLPTDMFETTRHRFQLLGRDQMQQTHHAQPTWLYAEPYLNMFDATWRTIISKASQAYRYI